MDFHHADVAPLTGALTPAKAGVQFSDGFWIPAFAGMTCAGIRLGIDRWLAGKLRRDLDHRFADQHGNRIQIAGVTLQS